MPETSKQGMMEGKNKILLVRNLKNAEQEEAKKPLYQTSHSFSLSRDADGIITKDGTIVKLGELEGEFSGIEGIVSKGAEVLTIIQDSILNGEMLEIWEVAIDEDLVDDNGKYPAIYARGFMTDWELEAGAEDEAPYSGDFKIEQVPQFGYATVDANLAEEVQYAFKDTDHKDPKPSAPKNVTLDAVGDVTIDVSWDEVSGATTYNVYLNGTVNNSGESVTSYQITDLTASETYSIQVTAVNSNGESVKTVALRVKTSA